MANPKTGWSGYSGTFHWALDQIVTATGDWTTIAYTTYTSPYTGLPERTLYPTQITYNGHTNYNGYSANVAGPDTIIFQTEVRTNDWRFSYGGDSAPSKPAVDQHRVSGWIAERLELQPQVWNISGDRTLPADECGRLRFRCR